LLFQEAIQADLGLSDKQKTRLNGIQAGFGQKSRDTFQALQESGAEPQEFQETMVGLQREHQASLTAVLDKTQKARLSQIELQREGFLAAARSEIASKLKLNPTQTKKIKTILSEMRQAQAQAMPGMLGALQPPPDGAQPATKGAAKTKKGAAKAKRPATTNPGGSNDEMGLDGEMPGGEMGAGGLNIAFVPGGGPPGGLPDFLKPENQPAFAKMMEAQKKSRDEASVKIGEILTAEQKTAFEKLTGKPFDFSKLQTAAPDAKPAEDGEAKPDDAMKKEATPPPASKSQPKNKSKTLKDSRT
jgi:hypothetical protein